MVPSEIESCAVREPFHQSAGLVEANMMAKCNVCLRALAVATCLLCKPTAHPLLISSVCLNDGRAESSVRRISTGSYLHSIELRGDAGLANTRGTSSHQLMHDMAAQKHQQSSMRLDYQHMCSANQPCHSSPCLNPAQSTLSLQPCLKHCLQRYNIHANDAHNMCSFDCELILKGGCALTTNSRWCRRQALCCTVTDRRM